MMNTTTTAPIFLNTDNSSTSFTSQQVYDMMDRLGPNANEADALYTLYQTNGSIDEAAITSVLENGNWIVNDGGFEAMAAEYAKYNLVHSW